MSYVLNLMKILDKIYLMRKFKAIEKLLNQQQSELEKFDQIDNTGTILSKKKKFTKFSQKCQNIETQEKKFAKAKHFLEANQMKVELEHCQQIEQQEQDQKWNDYLFLQRQKLLNQHQSQLNCFRNQMGF